MNSQISEELHRPAGTQRTAAIEPAHLALVQQIATKMYAKYKGTVELDDFIQDGWFGLRDALRKFDPSRAVKFSTYAARRIAGEMTDCVRRRDYLTRTMRARGNGPKLQSMSFKIGVRDGRDATVGDMLEDGEALRGLASIESDDWFQRLIIGFYDRERDVLTSYFRRGQTMREIGLRVDLSESRVSQLIASMLVRLKARLLSDNGLLQDAVGERTGATMLTAAQKLAASARVPDGDESLMRRVGVPLTSAGGRYDDGIPDIDPTEHAQKIQEAQAERVRRIAAEEESLESANSDGAASLLDLHPDQTADEEFERQRREAEQERLQMIARAETEIGRKRSNAAQSAAPKMPVTVEAVTIADEIDLRDIVSKGPSVATEAANLHLPRPVYQESRAVRRRRDGRIFSSVNVAGASVNRSGSAVRLAIIQRRPCGDEEAFFEWADEPPLKDEDIPPRAPRAIPNARVIFCTTTNETFPSLAECCRKQDVGQTALNEALATGRPVKGKTYRYIDGQKTATENPNVASVLRSKPIRCVETGEVYKSSVEAAQVLGVTPQQVRSVVNTNRLINGKTLVHADPEAGIEANPALRARPIRCKETGEVAESIMAATKKFGVGQTALHRALKNEKPAKGRTYEYVDAIRSTRERELSASPATLSASHATTSPPRANARRIRCRETGEEAESVLAASRKFGVSQATIYDSIKRSRVVRGMTFEYVGEAAVPSRPPVMNARAVRCVETGEVFPSTDAAGSKFGVTGARVRSLILRSNALDGKTFEYVEVAKPPQNVPAAPSAVSPSDPAIRAEVSVARTASASDDTTFIAKAMFAFAKGGGTVDQVDAVISEARRIAEARRIIAAIDGLGGAISLKDGRLVAVGGDS